MPRTRDDEAARMREWRLKNPDKVREANRAWRKANPEKVRAQQARWRERNPDKVKAKKARYLKNRTPEQVEASRLAAAAWRAANPDYPGTGGAYKHDRHVVLTFGLRPGEYAERLAAQGGGCKICGKQCATGKRLAVDHDCNTGAVRGLLCKDCNVGLGSFKDSHELLAAAARYLEDAAG